MSPEKGGRPFSGEERKAYTIRLRMEPKEVEQLDYCASKLSMTRSGTIREGLRLLMEKLDKKEK